MRVIGGRCGCCTLLLHFSASSGGGGEAVFAGDRDEISIWPTVRRTLFRAFLSFAS